MLGVPQTYLALGRFYENGLGTEPNLDTAISYYKLALSSAEETLSLENAAGFEEAKIVYDDVIKILDKLS